MNTMDTKTDTNPPILCVRCGGSGASVYAVGMWSHYFWSDCIEHLTARVEAAEGERNTAGRRAFNAEAENQRLTAENRRLAARVAELEAELASDAADENQWLDAYIESAAKDGATIKRLMARAAELEAQLAAQQWRPGSETPVPDWYQTVETIEGVFSHTYFDGASWHGYYDNLPPLWYRPIPPLPPAPVKEPTP